MKPLNAYLLQALLLLPAIVPAQTKYSRVKVTIPSQGLSHLFEQGIDIDHAEFNKQENTFITTLNNTDLEILKKNGVAYSVLIDDEVANFVKTNSRESFYSNADAIMVDGKLHFETNCSSNLNSITVPVGFIPGAYGGYYTFAQMQQRIDSLVNRYPALVRKIILPTTTAGGRPLIVVKISDNAATDENEPEALYTGLHHAREGMSMMNLFFFMQYLVENYGSDTRIRNLVDNRELFFIPCFNPDGYVYNETSAPSGGGMWRKNRRNNGGGSYGVDLNRNYSVDWGVTGPNVSISTNPSNDAYIGPSPFSEPETQALRAFAETRHFTIAIDHHAYGNYYVTPYGRPANHTVTTQDARFYSYASALMSRYNGYFAGDGMATVNYYAVGNSRDWHITGDIGVGTKQKTYGYTVEVGPGNLGFWPSTSNIIPIAKSMVFANMQMAYMAGSYFELQDLNDVAVTSPAGNFSFSLRRIGLTDAPVTVTIIPLEGIQNIGSAATINSMPNYFDSTALAISYALYPGINAGDRIRFVYQVSSGGITLRDTIVKFYQPVVMLSENMEGTLTTNWTLTGSWGASTLAAFNGSRSLSESPGGNYGSNISSNATYRTVINLSNATAAYLSFWVKHRAQNSYDKMQIQLAANGNGGGASWQSVCGNNTIAENIGTLGGVPALTGIRDAWTREVIDLRNYVGMPSVGLRFLFTSNGSEVDDGFYIDNVEIVKSTAILLGTKFIDVRASQVTQGVQISWEATLDGTHAYFEVERSTDGDHFVPVGRVTGAPPYRLTDPSPASYSYYRVVAVDSQGKRVYSKMVSVRNIPAYTVNVTPNPVKNTVYIKFNLTETTDFQLLMSDITGRTMYQQQIKVTSGNSQRTIDMDKWPSQVYFLKIRNMSTMQETVFKLVKN
jgi:carboxypeptidase T